jgi:hypothetical protein
MTSSAAVRDVPRFIKWAMIVCAFWLGGGYAFGPPDQYASPTFDLLKSVMPIPVWGAIFLFVGMVMIVTRWIGNALAVVAWGTWGLVLFLYAMEHHMAGWGGVGWSGFFVASNAYEVYRGGQVLLLKLRASEGAR